MNEAKISAGAMLRMGVGSTGQQGYPNRNCELAHIFSSSSSHRLRCERFRHYAW
jgi:hypothetical protein